MTSGFIYVKKTLCCLMVSGKVRGDCSGHAAGKEGVCVCGGG